MKKNFFITILFVFIFVIGCDINEIQEPVEVMNKNTTSCLTQGESGDGECCEGLEREPGCFWDEEVNQCVCINCYVCLKCIKTNCGNGICDDKEDKCSCSEDCS